jgi:circadian clock protein KaiC
MPGCNGGMSMVFIDRMATGVPGLDKMIEGGLPMPSLILIAGDIGSGKTTLCNQFLCKGARLGERGLYFMTCGGPPEWVIKYISTYEFVERWYFGEAIEYINLEKIIEEAGSAEEILDVIQSNLERSQARRLVIDSISVIEEALLEEFRKFILKLSIMVKEQRAVALVTGDSMPEAPYPMETAQIADGIILLQNTEVNMTRRRSIEILKMCGTSHHLGKSAVDISVKGLTVYPGL